MKFPKVFSYGDYNSNNSMINTLCFEDGADMYWFSYETLVAFRINGEFHISKNYWGTTTGKHLNWIYDDKSIREDTKTFEANYKRLKGEN